MKAKMKYQELFELEGELKSGITTKYWTLLKPLTKLLSRTRKITEPLREQLATTDSIKKFNKELEMCQAKYGGKSQDVLQEKMRELRDKNVQAQVDAVELRSAEREMLQDTVELTVDQIPESFFHDEDELRISTNLYMVLDRLGIVEHEDSKPKLKGVNGGKK